MYLSNIVYINKSIQQIVDIYDLEFYLNTDLKIDINI